MKVKHCGLGPCVVLSNTKETILVMTDDEFIVGSHPCITEHDVSWHWGHYYPDIKTAVSAYNEAVSRETP